MRDAKLADTNTRMLLKSFEQLADMMRLVAWDLARCTPDAPHVSWDQHTAHLENMRVIIETAKQKVVFHERSKRGRAKPATT